MFKYILFFVIFSPLLGIILMENGAYGWVSRQYGYINGVSIAYLMHALVLLFFTFITIKKGFTLVNLKNHKEKWSDVNFCEISKIILLINFLFLLIMLFGFGGYKVLMQEIGKGEFRSETIGLWGGGAFAYMITKVLAPILLSYLSF